MATVSELKDKARDFEQSGQLDQALKIYQHILKHFEGTPNLLNVLPLYVKVGDLHMREGRTEAAVSAYETAAKEYAIHGAAQRVDALCSKIERVDSSRADSHARLAQKLIDHGHPGSARDVLAAYAEKQGLTEISETLEDLAGRSMDEVEPLLLKLLASWGDGAAAPPEGEAARLSSQVQFVTDQEAGELAPAPAGLDEADAGVTTPNLAAHPEPEPAAEPEPAPQAEFIDLGSESPPEPEQEEEEPAEEEPAAEFVDETAPAKGPAESTLATVRPVTTPVETVRRSDSRGHDEPGKTGPRIAPLGGPSREPEMKSSGTRISPVAMAAGIAAALAAGFLGGRFTASGGSDSPPAAPPPAQVAAEPEPATPPAPEPTENLATADTTPEAAAADSSVLDSLATDTSAIGAPADSIADTTGTEVTNPPAVTPPPGDVIDPPGTTNPPPPEADAPTDSTLTPVVVDGLQILSVSDAELRGQAGFRVVHQLDDSGAEFTVESYRDTTGRTTGTVTVTATETDILIGILRMEGRMVYASGAVPEDSLRALMSRLVIQN